MALSLSTRRLRRRLTLAGVSVAVFALLAQPLVMLNVPSVFAAVDIPAPTVQLKTSSGIPLANGSTTNEKNFTGTLNASGVTATSYFKMHLTVTGLQSDKITHDSTQKLSAGSNPKVGAAEFNEVALTVPFSGNFNHPSNAGQGVYTVEFQVCKTADECSEFTEPTTVTYDANYIVPVAPTIESVSRAQGDVVLEEGDNFTWTVDADPGTEDTVKMYVDIWDSDGKIIKGVPQGFYAYPNEDNPYGDKKSAFESLGANLVYSGEGKWTVDFGDEVTKKIVANGGLLLRATLYKDSVDKTPYAGTSYRYNVSRVAIDTTAPEVSDVVLNGKNVNIARDNNCGPVDFKPVRGTIDLSATIEDYSGVASATYKIRKVTEGGCTQRSVYQSDTAKMQNTTGNEWETVASTALDTSADVDLVDGNYTIQLEVKDAAGNKGNKYIDITVDNTPPAIDELIVVQDGVNISGKATDDRYITVKWKGSDNNLSHYVYVNKNGEHDKGLDTQFSGDMGGANGKDGVYTYKVYAVDKAGNKSSVKSVSVTLDTEDPSLTVASPSADVVMRVDGDYALTGTVSDNLSGFDRLRLDINDITSGTPQDVGEVIKVTDFDGQSWSYAVSAGTLQDGHTYNFTFKAYDKANNLTTIRRTITIDNTAPALTDVRVTGEGSMRTISGITEPGAKVFVLVEETPYELTASSIDGSWNLFLNVSGFTYDTPYPYSVYAEDAYGNKSAAQTDSIIVPNPGARENLNQRILGADTFNFLANRSALAATPATPAAVNDGPRILGAEDVKNPASIGSDTAVLAATDQGWTLAGMAWYWWLAIVAAIAGLWWFIAGRRHRAADSL